MICHKKIFMKNRSLITGILIFLTSALYSQKFVTINDRSAVISEAVESNISARLRADSLELTSLIDNRKRCDYWFTVLSKEGNELQLSMTDCNDRLAGTKNLGSVIFSASDQEKALLIYYAIAEIIKNPFRQAAGQTEKSPVNSEPLPPADPGQHKSRYFFAPSAYNLEKGELYYNTLYFFLHDVQYGITDRFSMGMGTTIVGFPFYLTPKITFPIDGKSALALGDMLMIGTYGSRFTGNLIYLTYSRGNNFSHFTFGGGYLVFTGRDIDNRLNSPVINFSALGRISDHIYFITENYISYSKPQQTAYYYDYNTGYSTQESYSQSSFFMYNLIGFRFINKVKDVKCWQVGLSFITSAFGKIPDYYTNSNFWQIDNPPSRSLLPIPVIGYARKFGTRY